MARSFWNSPFLAQIPSEEAEELSDWPEGDPDDPPPAVETGGEQGDDSQRNRGPDENKETENRAAASEKPKEYIDAQLQPSHEAGSSNPPAGKPTCQVDSRTSPGT